MTISMYQASIPVFIRMLNNFVVILEKAATHVETNKIEALALINFRLYPDMLPFSKQVQIAADAAKIGIARLTGIASPKDDDNETTFPELIARLHNTIAHLKTFKPEQIDGLEDKEIIIQSHGTTLTYRGQDFLLNRALPNFYFHLTTAYDILRHNGVTLGKRDYLGPVSH